MSRRRLSIPSITVRIERAPQEGATRLAAEVGDALARAARDVAPASTVAVRVSAPAGASATDTARAIAAAIAAATGKGR